MISAMLKSQLEHEMEFNMANKFQLVMEME